MKGFTVPEECDYTIDEVQPVLDLLGHINPDKKSLFYGMAAMYDYGFKKGAGYAKSKVV